ncbi:MAG: ATP-binding protein [Acidobacteriota bacterium]
MTTPFSRISLLWKILVSMSVAITLVFAITGWIAVNNATNATAESVNHEVEASFQAYQSLWKARADRLSSVSAILAAMSDVRAAFGTGDEATIRDTAAELWSRVSDEDAIFLVATPQGKVIASLGGLSRESLPSDLPEVREALSRFPSQASGFLARGGHLYHLTITPVYVQSSSGTALLNVLVGGYDIDRGVAEQLKRSTGGSEFLFLLPGRVVASTLPLRASSEIAAQLAGSKRPVRSGASAYAPLITPLADIHGAAVGQLAILRSFDAAGRKIAALRRNLSLLWLFSMLAGLGLTYLMASRIVEPVKRLDLAAAEVARRNYDCQLPVESQDELGRLAATFNAMCASIRQARAELIRSERISTIGRLATSIVHDLRNPLAAICGGAEMLIGSQLSASQTQRLAANMYRASLQVQDLLQDLLDLGRGKAGQVKRQNLRELVDDVVDSFAAAAEAQSVVLLVNIPAKLELPLNHHRMERVFFNLIGNAMEAMPHGGTISISATVEPDSALVEVRDTGPGIAPEIRSRLFQPFVTAGKASGLGLGLALARQTVVDHGGDMWAESNGHGARFSFRLPLESAIEGDPESGQRTAAMGPN